jgi:hypothetical protein
MDIEKVKDCIHALTVSDHMGDVNGILPRLCRALDLPVPIWCDEYLSYTVAWYNPDLSELDEPHNCDNERCPYNNA